MFCSESQKGAIFKSNMFDSCPKVVIMPPKKYFNIFGDTVYNCGDKSGYKEPVSRDGVPWLKAFQVCLYIKCPGPLVAGWQGRGMFHGIILFLMF